MKNWKKVLISKNTSIREAIKVIDEGALQIALVVDTDRRLLGTVTDGDVRRGILKGIGLEEPAARIMNPTPTVAQEQKSREEILELLRQKSLHQVPVLDPEGRLVGLEVIEDLLRPQTRENLVRQIHPIMEPGGDLLMQSDVFEVALDAMDVLDIAEPGATFLLNTAWSPDTVWARLPRHLQQHIVDKQIKVFVIDGFSHIILICHLHKASTFKLRVVPYLDTEPRGLFATRAPSRPNPIGLSVVRLLEVEGRRLRIEGVDLLP